MTPIRILRSHRVRWTVATLLATVAIGGLAGCGSPPVRSSLPAPAPEPAGKQTFTLSSADIDTLKKQAGAGSGPAAYRLSLYYETVRHDSKEAMRWMKASAESGDVGGMYGYAAYLKTSDDPADKVTARTWLEKVIAQGDEVSKAVARRDLRELDADQKAER